MFCWIVSYVSCLLFCYLFLYVVLFLSSATWLLTQCVNKRELNSIELNYYINMFSPKHLVFLQTVIRVVVANTIKAVQYNKACLKIPTLTLETLLAHKCRSQWPRGLRRRSAAARLLRSWVRIPPGAWIFV